ncbi:MAG TPA: adenylate/guanylate cyclase domain-containing protein [Actinomycetota bacterium]
MPRPAHDAIAAGRDALERHAWQEAYETLSAADREGSFPAEGLQLLAESAWWSAHPDETIDALERAYAAYLEEGDRASAGMMAFRVAEQHGMRGAGPQAQGWASRAEKLAAEIPESPVHGWLAWIRGLMTLVMGGDEEEALAHYDRALEIADRLGDRDLTAMSLHDKGHILCSRGEVTEGLALMDEVMVAAVGGELDPQATGYVYCGMIGICSRLADYRRAAEWTEATTRWCERHSITGFPGICRVHRAELLRLRGALASAEEEALRACEELPQYNLYSGVGHAFYEIGEIRRRMGDHTAAEKAYARAHEHGRSPQPGLSLLRLAQGNVVAAASGVAQALAEAGGDRLARAPHLAAQATIALAADDLETAASAAEDLGSIVGEDSAPAMRATAACVRGAVLLARGDAAGALPELREAREGWGQVEAPYEAAEVRLLLAKAHRALGNEDAAHLEARAARAAFEQLGARWAAEEAGRVLGTLASGAAPPERVRRAFMFTDIERSTDLVGVIGDEAWESLLTWHDQTLRSLFASHGGDVAHHTGDGFFVSFDDADTALACAVAVQRALADHRRSHGFAPQVRIGVHLAEATRRGQDYGGAEVHKAARIAAEARGGEILASEETARVGGTTVSGDPRTVSLKGISEPVRVVPVRWRDG